MVDHLLDRGIVDDVAYLDGAHISKKSGFLYALGETVNSTGGYFGANLDDLADCTSSSFGERPLVRIISITWAGRLRGVGQQRRQCRPARCPSPRRRLENRNPPRPLHRLADPVGRSRRPSDAAPAIGSRRHQS
ncbi:barstar family protein [Streptomyces sioyaensis]|uniref:barstar family protein n=1 Tax=Streptomyces sioyaensis TaxID=67364 RepID=UPI0037A0AB30